MTKRTRTETAAKVIVDGGIAVLGLLIAALLVYSGYVMGAGS